MFTAADVRPLSVAIGSATLIGLGVGLWLTLPSMSAPAPAEAEVAEQIDPNLAAYRRMMADNGISPTPHILVSAQEPAPRETVITQPVETETVASTDLPEQAALSEPRPDPEEAVEQEPSGHPQADPRVVWVSTP